MGEPRNHPLTDGVIRSVPISLPPPDPEAALSSLRPTPPLLVAALAVLFIGGFILAGALRDQHDARRKLTELQIANSNLELVVQARIDEALDQRSLALTSASDEDLEASADHLRSLSSDVDEELDHLFELDRRVGDDEHPSMGSLSGTLDSIASHSTLATRDRLDSAEARTWWAFWLTGGATAALVVAALTVNLRDRTAL